MRKEAAAVRGKLRNGAGRTAPAAGNGTGCRCTPAQGARRDRIGTPQTKKAALAGSLYRGYTTGLQGNLNFEVQSSQFLNIIF